MNDDQSKGRAKDVGGKIKETAGDLTGNKKMEHEGQADQAEGKVQKTWGDAKDDVKKS